MAKLMTDMTRNRFSTAITVGALSVVFSMLTRIMLLAGTHASGISIAQFTGAVLIGLLYDLAVAAFVMIPFLLHLWGQNNFIYEKKVMPLMCTLFIVLIALLQFTNIIPKDFSPQLHTALVFYTSFRFVVYLLLYCLPYDFRLRWRKGVLYFSFTLMVFLLLFNAISEWFFWQEFSSRYNFIAVDYLVYTTEVLGNITESYPIAVIVTTLLVLAVMIVILFRRAVQSSLLPMRFAMRSLLTICLLLAPLLAYFALQEKWRHFSQNEYANSLAGNGLFEFATAFNQNELDFYKFYRTLPDTTAFKLVRQQLCSPNSHYTGNDPYSIERQITYAAHEKKLNIVLISVESLSADFMQFFGSKENITPYLDSLSQQSLFFTNLYASGTRTVRGLEALSLSIPPTPGQSIIKRPDNSHLFSLGSVLRSKGYITQYLYGGYSYFDNMKKFFEGNGYEVIDRSAIPASQIHYQNIWGVADEDLFTLALHVLDSNSATGKPFFSHIMTVSNHRPYTYPDGRIDIPSSRQVRQGAVKYTDYAIHKFLTEARHKKWFDNTLFVIVADHCAGSAGSVELPVSGYHIPMLIYAPLLLQPKQINTLTAQIDVGPTILGLLKLDYKSKFFGQDVLNIPSEKQHAFISTYQGLGYLHNGRLIIQSPVKSVSEYVPDFTNGGAAPAALNDTLACEAIAWYQSISWLLKHKKQSE